MHQYLRAVGFSKIKTKKELKDLMNDLIFNSNEKDYIETDRDSILIEYSKNYSPSSGLTIRGEYDKEQDLTMDFYFPYVRPHQISTQEAVSVERHAQNESFAGVCEDYRVGVTLIFYVQNGMKMMKKITESDLSAPRTSVGLSALSINGIVMLPIMKDEGDKNQIKKAANDRNKQIVAAKAGDEEAIEKLTLEDIDTYNVLSKRILTDDVFTLVDSFLMPYGVECDQYSVLGEIEEVTLEKNYLTEEESYVMTINCNNLPITLCINKADLLGEPLVGRRFKGDIWLSGVINS